MRYASSTISPDTRSLRIIAILAHQHRSQHHLRIWGHDHDGAYRQLPLDQPMLWSHNVLLCGSSASVWGYNHFGDSMVAVSRVILLWPTMHYVDDYGSTEITPNSSSGFTCFEDFNGAIGYNIKASKCQPPAASHKTQGVIISTDADHVALTPCPQRVKRMSEEIRSCLRQDCLDPELAQRMAGKCNFATGRLFGKVGPPPPLKPSTPEHTATFLN